MDLRKESQHWEFWFMVCILCGFMFYLLREVYRTYTRDSHIHAGKAIQQEYYFTAARQAKVQLKNIEGCDCVNVDISLKPAERWKAFYHNTYMIWTGTIKMSDRRGNSFRDIKFCRGGGQSNKYDEYLNMNEVGQWDLSIELECTKFARPESLGVVMCITIYPVEQGQRENFRLPEDVRTYDAE